MNEIGMSTGEFVTWAICLYVVGVVLACVVTEELSLGWRRLLIPFGPITAIGAVIWLILYAIFAIGSEGNKLIHDSLTKEQL